MAVVGAGGVGAHAATQGAEAGALSGGCIDSWPTAMDDRIDLSGTYPSESGNIPDGGDLVIYVHGLFSDDILDSIDINGANQGAALQQALDDYGISHNVVTAMWNSTTSWTPAKYRAEDAGETLARWLQNNYWKYNSVTILAHSLGARVIFTALNVLDSVTVDSVGVLGGAVNPDAVCGEFEAGIEQNADEVYNYHSDNDNIVCNIYAIREWTSAVGCGGGDCNNAWWDWGNDPTPANYEDVDVTSQVDGHCNYYKPDSMETGNCVQEIVSRQL